jgi:hypothetical protein
VPSAVSGSACLRDLPKIDHHTNDREAIMTARLAIALLFAALSSFAHAQWQQMPGRGTDIGVGARGDVWVLGTDRVNGGFSIHRWRDADWERIDGGAVRIDVDPQGRPWVVNTAGDILRREGADWRRLPGRARDIGIGANGAVWVVGVDPAPGGYALYRWKGEDWDLVPGGAVRIDIGPAGEPWAVNDRGEVLRGTYDGRWERLPGSGSAVTVDGTGNAWLLGTDRVDGGRSVHRWTGSGWERLPGGAVALSAGRDLWLVNSEGNIYRWDPRR